MHEIGPPHLRGDDAEDVDARGGSEQRGPRQGAAVVLLRVLRGG